MEDSDFSGHTSSLTVYPGLCLWLGSLRFPVSRDLLAYPINLSRRAVHADAARTMSRPRLLSGRLLTAFIHGTGTRLSGAIPFDAHLMWFTFITACLFDRPGAYAFASRLQRPNRSSGANSLIRRTGLPPAWLLASPAHAPSGAALEPPWREGEPVQTSLHEPRGVGTIGHAEEQLGCCSRMAVDMGRCA